MRVTGCILIFFSAAACGLFFAAKQKKLERIYAQTVTMTGMLIAFLQYDAPALADLLSRVSRSGNCTELSYLGRTLDIMQTGAGFQEAFEDALSEFCRGNRCPEYYDAVFPLGDLLGAGRAENQSRTLEAMRKNLQQLSEQVRLETEKRARLCRSLGVGIGAAAAFVLI